jgi:hypothetical protein
MLARLSNNKLIMRPVSPQQNMYNPTNGLRPVQVGSYRHVVAMVTVTVAGAASTVARFRASAQEVSPAFASAATQQNFHTPVQAKNLDTGATINGSTGIPVDATGVFMYEINTNLIEHLVSTSQASVLRYSPLTL